MSWDQDHQTEEQQPVKQSFCTSLRRDTHWKCLILTLLIYGCLAAIAWCRLSAFTHVVVNFNDMTSVSQDSPCDDGYIYIPVAFVAMLYLVYLVECWHCHTRIELQCKVDVNTVYERIQAMREAVAIVWWKAICYHYVRRTRQVTRYRNGDAFTTTQVYYERVNSHTASSAFNFTHCGIKDVSKKLVNLERYSATKIRFSKGFSFCTVEAEREFEDQRAQFFHDHERRDDYLETREGLDMMNINFKEYLIAFAGQGGLPWYVSHVVFWFASLLLLSWPLRVIIEFKTAYVHYHVHKVFGCNYLDSNNWPGAMSRVSTMGSSELEMNIRNNYNIVPSYSEALLMDSSAYETQDANGNIARATYGATTVANQPNGTVPNGVVSNGHTQSELSANGHIANGTVPHIIIRRSWSGDYVGEHASHQKRSKRKRKRRRHSFTEATQTHSDSETGQRPSSQSYAPTLASTPESLYEDSTNTLPLVDSYNGVLNRLSEEVGDAAQQVEQLPGPEEVEEAPPAYDVAVTMRGAPGITRNTDAQQSSQLETELTTRPQNPIPPRRTFPTFRLMETSL